MAFWVSLTDRYGVGARGTGLAYLTIRVYNSEAPKYLMNLHSRAMRPESLEAWFQIRPRQVVWVSIILRSDSLVYIHYYTYGTVGPHNQEFRRATIPSSRLHRLHRTRGLLLALQGLFAVEVERVASTSRTGNERQNL